MLAVHAAKYARSRQVELHFLHVHHGLQAGADQWQAHVHDLAHRLNVPCHSLRVRVDQSGGDGMESAARTARYQALASLAAPLGVTHILLAHHQDDQAETVLLRLLRGAGPEGLGAMAPMRVRDGLVYLRPWLEVARSEILRLAGQFGELTGWHPVCDPTNSDDRYTRAAVRERLAPVLDDRWPGWQANLVRHAGLSREMALVLDEVASNDFKQLEPAADAGSFSLRKWRELPEHRQALLLRYWLALQGQRMPTQARLQDLMRQLRHLHAMGHDRQMQVKHGDRYIRCIKGRIILD